MASNILSVPSASTFAVYSGIGMIHLREIEL